MLEAGLKMVVSVAGLGGSKVYCVKVSNFFVLFSIGVPGWEV